MPNARDTHIESPQRFLVTGLTGGGKSTNFLTLPGKKFMYIFDPNALASIEGFDVDYEEFNVEATDVDMSVKTLKADVGDKPSGKIEPRTYVKWEEHFEKHLEKGFFNNYDWIGFDSFTLFSDIVMDRILYLNKRPGKQPEQADWAAQVNTIGNVFRVLSNLKAGIYCTGHVDTRQDELTKKIYNRPMMTGRLRVRIPLLFNNVLVAISQGDEKGQEYLVQTRPDREYPVVRTNLKGLEMFEDVTIPEEAFKKPELLPQYGLGALLRKAGKLPATKPTAQPRRVHAGDKPRLVHGKK